MHQMLHFIPVVPSEPLIVVRHQGPGHEDVGFKASLVFNFIWFGVIEPPPEIGFFMTLRVVTHMEPNHNIIPAIQYNSIQYNRFYRFVRIISFVSTIRNINFLKCM